MTDISCFVILSVTKQNYCQAKSLIDYPCSVLLSETKQNYQYTKSIIDISWFCMTEYYCVPKFNSVELCTINTKEWNITADSMSTGQMPSLLLFTKFFINYQPQLGVLKATLRAGSNLAPASVFMSFCYGSVLLLFTLNGSLSSWLCIS